MRYLVSLVVFSVVVPLSNAANLEYRSAITSATAMTKDFAVTRALIKAVSQVNGVSIGGKTQVSARASTRGQSTFTSSDSMSIASLKSSGVVNKHRVLEEDYDAKRGLWTVKVDAEVALLSKNSERKTVTVFEFSEPSPIAAGRSFSEEITNQIKSRLTASRKFSVIETNFEEETASYLKRLASNPLIPLAERILVKKGVPPELIVLGSARKIRTEFTDPFPDQKLGISIPKGNVEASIQVISTSDSLIKYQDSVSLEFDLNDFRTLGRKITKDNLYFSTVELAAKKITKNIMDQIYPVLLTSISKDNDVSLNFGEEFLNAGDTYEIFIRSGAINDPYTKENISWNETLVGEVLVTRTLPKISFGKLSTKHRDLYKKFEPKRYVAYLKKNQKRERTATSKKIENSIELLETEY